MSEVIPSSLAVNLKSFQKTSQNFVRVNSDRTAYPSASMVSFRLPQSGCVDLDTLHFTGELSVSHGAVVTLTTPPTNFCMFRRVEVMIGGYALGSACSDFGFSTYLLKAYTNNKMRQDYLQGMGSEGSVVVSSINGTVSFPLAWSDGIGFLNCSQLIRYLPLSLIPEVIINVYLHDRSRWTVEDNSAIAASTFVLQNMRIQYMNISSEGSLIENLWASRLSQAPIVIPFQDIKYYEGSSTSATANTFTLQVSGTSLDYLVATYRVADYDTVAANRLTCTAGNNVNTVTSQIFVNNQPLQSYQCTPIDALMVTSASLGGSGNQFFAPDAGGLANTFAGFRDTFFALIQRLEFPTEDTTDPRGWLTGLNTMGTSVPVDLVLQGANTTGRKPVIIVVGKGLLTIGAGKQISVTP